MLFDMPLERLREYRPDPEEPADFDAFWAKTLTETGRHGLDAGFATVDVFDVTFRGWGGQPVKAWLMLPRVRSGPLPAVVQYIGYNGGRGIPYSWLTWSALGYAHLVMDNRGQGGGGKNTADTPDIGPDGHASSSPGFLTRGIEDPYRHYYRRLITDAVRAVDAAKAHGAVDASRVAVLGGSQGGGLALAVAGLRDDVVAVVADVPFLCHYRRASQITDAGPYAEIARWLSGHRFRIDEAMETLSYFDGGQLRGTGDRSGVVLGRADGQDLPVVDGVRRLPPLCGSGRDRGVHVQRTRGRRGIRPAAQARRTARRPRSVGTGTGHRPSAAIAALWPGTPLTPPPRTAPAPHSRTLACAVSTPHRPVDSVAYGKARSRWKIWPPGSRRSRSRSSGVFASMHGSPFASTARQSAIGSSRCASSSASVASRRAARVASLSAAKSRAGVCRPKRVRVW